MTDYTQIEARLAQWKARLLPQLQVGGLFKRNSVAHKWKTTTRSAMLRELLLWRTHDLLQQSCLLAQNEHLLGARILLRSAFEPVAMLTYLNQITTRIVDGGLSFREFSDKTVALLFGSRNKSTPHPAINILTLLKSSEKRFKGLSRLYDDLSESAHPNHDGLAKGYCKSVTDELEINFSNQCATLYANEHPSGIYVCIQMFEVEYDAWVAGFEELEKWVELNAERISGDMASADQENRESPIEPAAGSSVP